jgi:hypothetical protein
MTKLRLNSSPPRADLNKMPLASTPALSRSCNYLSVGAELFCFEVPACAT